jgi:hypothetical protein
MDPSYASLLAAGVLTSTTLVVHRGVSCGVDAAESIRACAAVDVVPRRVWIGGGIEPADSDRPVMSRTPIRLRSDEGDASSRLYAEQDGLVAEELKAEVGSELVAVVENTSVLHRRVWTPCSVTLLKER